MLVASRTTLCLLSESNPPRGVWGFYPQVYIMSVVSSLPYFKVPVIMPLGSPITYQPATPIATVDIGTYLVVFNYAILGSTNGTSLGLVLLFIYQYAQGFGNTVVLTHSKHNTALTDSSGTFAGQCVIYRNLVDTFVVTQNNTPLFLSYDNTAGGGVTQSSSTAAQDSFYNYIHFIKVG